MKVLVVGSGGREHALTWKLFASPAVDAVSCAPGNAGIAYLAKTVDIDATDLPKLADFAAKNEVDLTIIGPEAPLADGIVDLFEERDLKVFGPTRRAAQLEWSKAWTKGFLERQGIPSSKSESVDTLEEARHAMAQFGYPVVLKADGLASGKGVFVVKTAAEADVALDELFGARAFGTASDRVVVEECLVGPELSVFAITDGVRWTLTPPARDYKRVRDGDDGPNTGGMGGYTRPADATPELMDQIEREIIGPTLRGMASEGRPYKGVLYAGLMLTAEGPKVIEFNCRFGDPEAELVLPLLESDLFDLCLQVAEGRLDPSTVKWGGGVTCGVVLAAPGYPEQPRFGSAIEGLDDLPPGVIAFHGGTKVKTGGGIFGGGRGQLVTSGGRVLTVVATGPTLEHARALVYEHIDSVTFDGVHYRHDIGIEGPPALVPAAPVSVASVTQPQVAPPVATPAPVAESGTQRIALIAANAHEHLLLREVARVMEQLGIAVQSSTVSAFHAPGVADQLVRDFERQGVRAIVAAAGSEPTLPGLLASWSGLPVIAVPATDEEQSSLDAMVAAAQVPEGAPVATVAPGSRGALTAAWLAAAIVAAHDSDIRRRYNAARQQRATAYA